MPLARRVRRLGWIASTLMWIPFATMFIGMIGLPKASYDRGELPLLSRYSRLVGGSLAAASTALLVGAPILSRITNRSVMRQGQTADARIREIWDTGTTINQNPVVRMLLEVHPPGGSTFQAETERLIPRLQLPQVQPGASVGVRYDPRSRAVAIVDADPATANSGEPSSAGPARTKALRRIAPSDPPSYTPGPCSRNVIRKVGKSRTCCDSAVWRAPEYSRSVAGAGDSHGATGPSPGQS